MRTKWGNPTRSDGTIQNDSRAIPRPYSSDKVCFCKFFPIVPSSPSIHIDVAEGEDFVALCANPVDEFAEDFRVGA